jgi:hypothetical protein
MTCIFPIFTLASIRRMICLLALTTSSATAQQLLNGDFEGSFQPVKVQPDTKATIQGEVALNWQDESSWANVSVVYSQDATGGHAKTSAQKIEVKSITSGAVQFAQSVQLKAGTYQISAWVRADKPSQGTLLLRQTGAPYSIYGTVSIAASTEWTQVSLSGDVTADGYCFVMFIPGAPGTFWLDDVALQAAK